MDIIDVFGRSIRFTKDRKDHIEEDHPEMMDSIDRIVETLQDPEDIRLSSSDLTVELFYKYFENTLVGNKYICIVVKNLSNDLFVITAYFTDKKKKGESKWTKE